jgi:hypothetical protein
LSFLARRGFAARQQERPAALGVGFATGAASREANSKRIQKKRSIEMRKALYAVSIAALAAALATPALANPPRQRDKVAPAVGVAGGTALGIGLTEGWIGPTVATAALPTAAVGAAAVGGVAGIGGVALVDAAIQPCAGFHAMLDLNEQYCAQQNAQQIALQEQESGMWPTRGVRHTRHYVR